MRNEEIFLPIYDNGNFRTIAVRDSGPIHAEHVFLCLPGLLETSSCFSEFSKNISNNQRVILLDYAGRGASEKLSDFVQYKMSSCLIDIYAAIVYVMGFEVLEKRNFSSLSTLNQRKRPDIHLVGNSMGGLLAVAFATNHPNIPTSIVLNDVGILLPWSGLFSMMGAIGRNSSFLSDGLLKLGANSFANELDVDPRLLRSVLKPAYADLAFEQNSQGLSFQKYFSKLKKPLLLVHSEESPLVNKTVLDAMKKIDLNVTFYSVEGSQHPAPYTPNIIGKILEFCGDTSNQSMMFS